VHCGIGTHRVGTDCVPGVLSSSTSTTPWTPNVRVSETTLDFAAECAMAVDSAGRIVIAAILFDQFDPKTTSSSGIGVWRSEDGGASFRRAYTAKPDQGRFLGDPAVLFDARDVLYVGWVDYGMKGMVGDVMIARSTDSSTFASAELIDPDGEGTFRDRPWLSVAPDGGVWVSWVYGSQGGYGAKRAVSKQGKSFSGVETIFATSEILDSPIAFDAEGHAVVATAAGGFGGEGLGAWRDLGSGWAPEPLLMTATAIDPLPQIRWSSKAGFVITFLAAPDFAISMYTMRSMDGGRTWIGPVPVDAAGPQGSSALPWMTTDEGGRVHLMWLDDREGGWRPYTAVSDDGQHFRSAERVGDASFTEDGDERRWIGDFNTVIARGGRRYATWTDSRDGKSAIYFSSAPGVD
jgi:hypothetical protein